MRENETWTTSALKHVELKKRWAHTLKQTHPDNCQPNFSGSQIGRNWVGGVVVGGGGMGEGEVHIAIDSSYVWWVSGDIWRHRCVRMETHTKHSKIYSMQESGG